MNDVIEFVRAFQSANTSEEKLRLGDELVVRISPDVEWFIHARCRSGAASDILQNTLTAIVTSLGGFRSKTDKEFW